MAESTWFREIDSFVERIHRTGFLQSFIVHVAALLAMAVVVVLPKESEKPPAFVLAFDTEPADPLALEEMTVAEVEMPSAPWEAADTDMPPAETDVEHVATLVEVPVESLEFGSMDEPEPLSMPDSLSLLKEIPAGPPQRPARSAGIVPAAFAGAGAGGGGDGGAIGGELGRRLQAAGAMTGDVQVSIAWNDINDIDVHVMVEPFGGGQPSLVCWTSRVGLCGGMLDVDANAHPGMLTNRPVENIFWRKGAAPYGRYTVAVHHYHSWSGVRQSQVEVAVLVDGTVKRFYPAAAHGLPLQVVTSFERRPDQPILGATTENR